MRSLCFCCPAPWHGGHFHFYLNLGFLNFHYSLSFESIRCFFGYYSFPSLTSIVALHPSKAQLHAVNINQPSPSVPCFRGEKRESIVREENLTASYIFVPWNIFLSDCFRGCYGFLVVHDKGFIREPFAKSNRAVPICFSITRGRNSILLLQKDDLLVRAKNTTDEQCSNQI